MVVAELDDVQYDLEVDGQQVRRQLGRQVWESRGWATIAIAYQERGTDGEWKPPRVALLRFRHVREAWKKEAAFSLPVEQARGLAETIAGWQLDETSES